MEKEESKQEIPNSVELMSLLVSGVWLLGWIYIIAITLALTLQMFGEDVNFWSFDSELSVPLRINFDPDQPIIVEETSNHSEITFIGHNDVIISTDSTTYKVYSYINDILYAIILVWTTFYIRRLFRALRNNELFLKQNPSLIKKIGYFLIIIGSAKILKDFIIFAIYAHDIAASYSANIVNIVRYGFYSNHFDFSFIFFGLAILVVSWLSKAGNNLQQEQELTI